VDRYATLKSGYSPNKFLYLSQKPKERDFATLVLLDSSLSTDSWLQNRRVLDVLKESVLVLGEVVEEFQDRMAIGAFYSNTRTDCRYIEVKKFDESWKRCQTKLVGLQPTGYTRIGPALRHGTHLLSQVQARKKLLLLISDGKPTDYDRYEGRYGIEDIRQSIRDAAKEHIAIRALAIEAQAKFYLPQMFGNGNFQILPNPILLARSLAEIYGWLSV
jgi:nitric oxide reductase NorD protein